MQIKILEGLVGKIPRKYNKGKGEYMETKAKMSPPVQQYINFRIFKYWKLGKLWGRKGIII